MSCVRIVQAVRRCGHDALTFSTGGANSTASGHLALYYNATGNYNTANYANRTSKPLIMPSRSHSGGGWGPRSCRFACFCGSRRSGCAAKCRPTAHEWQALARAAKRCLARTRERARGCPLVLSSRAKASQPSPSCVTVRSLRTVEASWIPARSPRRVVRSKPDHRHWTGSASLGSSVQRTGVLRRFARARTRTGGQQERDEHGDLRSEDRTGRHAPEVSVSRPRMWCRSRAPIHLGWRARLRRETRGVACDDRSIPARGRPPSTARGRVHSARDRRSTPCPRAG